MTGPDSSHRRSVERFGPHWRVLLSHLLLFGFIYPSERNRVPAWVMAELVSRLQEELACAAPEKRLCHGTILSGTQYGVDIGRWGYEDVLQGLDDPLKEAASASSAAR